MKRYDICITHYNYGDDAYMTVDEEGEYVLYTEAAARIAELERCLKTALEFVPKSVAKRLTVQGGLG